MTDLDQTTEVFVTRIYTWLMELAFMSANHQQHEDAAACRRLAASLCEHFDVDAEAISRRRPVYPGAIG